MDQLKLLNFHKMISNFANNLVGAFIPLIIYQATGNLNFAIIYLTSEVLLRLIFEISFKKLFYKYPQLILLLRIIPIALYNIFIFVIDVNLVVGIIGVCIFCALSNAMNNLPKEIILNYSSLSKKSSGSSLGTSRLFEKLGIIIALVLGGFLLDINKTLVLILALIIYAISVIPLVMFYIKCRKEKSFNKEAVSNALNTFSKNPDYKKRTKKIDKKLLMNYAIVYFLIAFYDILTNTFSLHVYIQKGEFALSGILTAILNCSYAISCYITSIANEKKDITKLVSVFAVLTGIFTIILPFLDINKHFALTYIIYACLGFTYPFISIFILDRMLMKSRIMGISNEALFTRQISSTTAYVIGYPFGFFGLIGIFICISVSMCASAFFIPYCEENTRKALVDYLQNNENRRK